MKTKAIMAAMLIACSVSVANAQTMKLILSSGSSLEFKTSEVTRVEFAEAEKKEDKPVTDDGQYHNGHEYVDLGLPSGNLWAKCNIGANSPEEYGDRYAWGETVVKEKYEKANYKYYASNSETYTDADGFTITKDYRGYTKYVILGMWDNNYGYKEFLDNKTELEPEDDVAHVKWEGNWTMPTNADCDELKTICTWVLTELKGVKGYKVTGPNNKYIFLVDDSHWSNSIYKNNGNKWESANARVLEGLYLVYNERYHGNAVRPVIHP